MSGLWRCASGRPALPVRLYDADKLEFPFPENLGAEPHEAAAKVGEALEKHLALRIAKRASPE